MITYDYDGVGNRISMTENGVETTYTYNSLNQLMSSAENGEDTTYTYDGRGNQIVETKGDVTTESTYSVRGEMVFLTKKNGDTVVSSQENQYNHDGIRIGKKEDGTTRHYYYDNGLIAYTKDGTTLSSANIVGPEGQVVGTFRGDDYHIYLKDIQGSTTNIVKQDGSLSAAYEYSDFGETEEITGSSFDNEICYTGAIYDDTTGLYYMNARYYDPVNGRFISQDTYRGEVKNPAQWHLYTYCANNPINYVDPSGHELISAFFVGLCLGGGILLTAYTTTAEFQRSWNRVTEGIENGLSFLSTSVRLFADGLTREIGNSFAKAKKKYGGTEVHHIVAQTATRAEPARKILSRKSVNIKINSNTNLVTLKKGLHRRLHRKSYYDMVNLAVETAYNKKGSKKSNVKAAIGAIKTYLKKLNKIVPF